MCNLVKHSVTYLRNTCDSGGERGRVTCDVEQTPVVKHYNMLLNLQGSVLQLLQCIAGPRQTVA